MKVIRQPAGIRVVSRERQEAVATAREIIQRAQSDAVRIRDEAQHEGEQRAHAEASALLIRATLAASAREKQDEAEVAQLATDVAKAVLGREAAVSTDVLEGVVRRAFLPFRRAKQVILQVHPDDLETARAHYVSWLPTGCSPEAIEIEAASTVGRGGVIVHTDIGKLDARLETQLDAIARALMGR